MKNIRKHALGTVLALATAGAASAATLPAETCTLTGPGVRTCDLYAAAGSTALPDGVALPVWGYASADPTVPTNPPVTAPGGPVLVVNQGETVRVVLHNQLGEATALLFQGQDMVPDTVGVAALADNGAAPYSFVASRPGTYLYEAGLLPNSQHQAAMGLYGALVVRPALAVPPPAPAAGQAYADAATAYDDEALVVLSEIDRNLNASPSPAAFDMRGYAPQYFLINGKAYPQTDEIATGAGRRVLLRYVNAGIEHHSMALLGMSQALVGKDGSPLSFASLRVAESLAPGESLDAIGTVPAGAADGMRFALHDGSLRLYNGSGDPAPGTTRFGGMLAFLRATAAPGADTAGPVASNLVLSPNPTTGLVAVALTAAVSDAATGGASIQAAEYRLDSTASVAMAAADGAFDGVAEAVQATIPAAALTGLPPGPHAVYVRGQDGLGNWGPFASATLTISDGVGPSTSALVLTPNPGNGTQDVALSATASDAAGGNANIQAAEYSIDGGAPAAMIVNAVSPVANVTATIPAATVLALAEGAHVVSVRSQDALGNWGAAATISLQVDKTGPAASAVAAAPNPTNGAIGFNSNTPAVRLTATAADPLVGSPAVQSRIAAAEGFIDTVGANGTGFPLVPADGAFNGFSEAVYADIPLTTISQLAAGNHTLHVRARDAAGNWGATGTVVLLVDRTAPVIAAGGVALTPSTIVFGTASVSLAVTASDGASGIAGGQFWIDGTTAPPASATSFSGTTATVPTGAVSGGIHSVRVRVRDGAGNWSSVASATLTVIQAVADARTVTANNNATQNSDANAAAGVLANDQPIGAAGRIATLVSPPTRISGTGAGTMSVSCVAALGTPVSANAVCSNGAYRLTLTGVGATGAARAQSKRGTFSFTYTETLNGVTTPPATVTITVN